MRPRLSYRMPPAVTLLTVSGEGDNCPGWTVWPASRCLNSQDQPCVCILWITMNDGQVVMLCVPGFLLQSKSAVRNKRTMAAINRLFNVNCMTSAGRGFFIYSFRFHLWNCEYVKCKMYRICLSSVSTVGENRFCFFALCTTWIYQSWWPPSKTKNHCNFNISVWIKLTRYNMLISEI